MGLSPVRQPEFELADIIRQHSEEFYHIHTPLRQHQRVMNAIALCRTVALGGHLDKCSDCNHIRISYNSCRNRHCPKCQSSGKERWIIQREADLLPCRYFHVVFTIPQELNSFCLKFPKELYNILFDVSRETLETFGSDSKFLGGQMGFISLLHTWGQNLSLHPHVHMIVPGICLTPAGYWKNANKKSAYLFPVKAMSVVYKNKFMEKLRTFLQKRNQTLDMRLRKDLYAKNWVVFAKTPFAGPQEVIEYLGRYTHKVAISNHRIKQVQDGKVSFTYKDYADKGKQKLMTLNATEFLRRFCMHILPPGYRKIRHYGFLSSRGKVKLKEHQFKTGILLHQKQRPPKLSWKEICKTKLNFDPDACPYCKTGRMIALFTFEANGPPAEFLLQLQKQPKLNH